MSPDELLNASREEKQSRELTDKEQVAQVLTCDEADSDVEDICVYALQLPPGSEQLNAPSASERIAGVPEEA